MTTNGTFKTTDKGLASFLMCNGYHIISISSNRGNPTEINDLVINFSNVQSLLITNYHNKTTTVEPIEFLQNVAIVTQLMKVTKHQMTNNWNPPHVKSSQKENI